jgi:hypothetical protein
MRPGLLGFHFGPQVGNQIDELDEAFRGYGYFFSIDEFVDGYGFLGIEG